MVASADNISNPQYSCVINGVDLSPYLEDASWTITQQWTRQSSTATFYLWFEKQGVNISVPPLSTIVFTDLGLNEVIFSGVVTVPNFLVTSSTLQEWELQCSDWTYLADHATVFGDFSNQTADQVVKTIVSQANCGLTSNNVSPGPLLPRFQIVYSDLSSALTTVCGYASTVATYGWFIDENRDVHFYNETQAGAPTAFLSDNVSDVSGVNYVPGFTGTYEKNCQYLWDASSIRNSITLRGASFTARQQEAWLGDGTQTTWPMTFTPDTQNPNAELVIGGVFKTVSIADPTLGLPTTQWLMVKNAVGNWSLTNNSDTAPAAAALITFQYNYDAPVLTRVQDTTSISQFSGLPNQGIFGQYIADSNFQSVGQAQVRGRQELHTFALPEERVSFVTSETFSGHIRSGDVITWKSTYVQDSQNSYLPGIEDTFLVVSNQVTGTLVGYRQYNITAARIATGGGP